MRRALCTAAAVAAAALAGCFGGGEDDRPQGRVTLSLPATGVDRPALDEALEKAGVRATIRSTDGAEILVARDDGSAESSVAWDEELAGKLQAQGLADCLGELEGQRVARVGTPTAQQRLGQTFVLEPLLEQDVLRVASDLRDADGILAADDRSAATALADAGPGAQVVGRGATADGLRTVDSGRQCLTLFESPARLARAAAALAAELADGEPAPRRPPRLAPLVVTRDTLGELCEGDDAAARCREAGL